MTTSPTPYEAVVLVSFGGPEGDDDVIPFLENVTAGRGVPAARLEEVAANYRHFGGVSPLNEQCRRIRDALTAGLDRAGITLPVYWGNRNWHPYLTDTVAEMTRDGIHRALALVTSAYSSYSACRQYLEDVERARAASGPDAPRIDKIRAFNDHPGFVEPFVDSVIAARERLPARSQCEARLVCTAHSIPLSMAETSEYRSQLEETASLVAARAGFADRDLVWQSRSGPPHVPWLEPDVNDHLRAIAAETSAVVIAPIGFVSDHLEVLWDLDEQAASTAAELGVHLERAATPGTEPDERFVEMLVALVTERLDPTRPRLALGSSGPRPDSCPADCCPPPRRS